MALPNYLVQLPSHNDVIVDIGVEEELNDRVNGGDSDDDGEYAIYFDYKMREVELERPHLLLGYDGIYQADEGEIKSVLLHVGDTIDPYEVKAPKEPYDWFDPSPNT